MLKQGNWWMALACAFSRNPIFSFHCYSHNFWVNLFWWPSWGRSEYCMLAAIIDRWDSPSPLPPATNPRPDVFNCWRFNDDFTRIQLFTQNFVATCYINSAITPSLYGYSVIAFLYRTYYVGKWSFNDTKTFEIPLLKCLAHKWWSVAFHSFIVFLISETLKSWKHKEILLCGRLHNAEDFRRKSFRSTNFIHYLFALCYCCPQIDR